MKVLKHHANKRVNVLNPWSMHTTKFSKSSLIQFNHICSAQKLHSIAHISRESTQHCK